MVLTAMTTCQSKFVVFITRSSVNGLMMRWLRVWRNQMPWPCQL